MTASEIAAETNKVVALAEIGAEISYLEGLAEALWDDGDAGSAHDVERDIEALKAKLEE